MGVMTQSAANLIQGRRKHLRLRGMTLRGHFFLKKKGTFFKNKKSTSFFITKSWGGTCPQCPLVPTSMTLSDELAQNRPLTTIGLHLKVLWRRGVIL